MRSQGRLRKQVKAWFEKASTKKLVAEVKSSREHIDDTHVIDNQVFIDRIGTRLPKYEAWLREAADLYGFDWQFLAAVAYQESHWNPKKLSAPPE